MVPLPFPPLRLSVLVPSAGLFGWLRLAGFYAVSLPLLHTLLFKHHMQLAPLAVVSDHDRKMMRRYHDTQRQMEREGYTERGRKRCGGERDLCTTKIPNSKSTTEFNTPTNTTPLARWQQAAYKTIGIVQGALLWCGNTDYDNGGGSRCV